MLTVLFWYIFYPQPTASSSRLSGAEYRELVWRLDRIKAEQKGLYACHVELNEAYQNSHIKLKGGQNLIMEQLRTILSMLHRTPMADPAPGPSVAASPSPSAMGKDDEVFPDEYDPYEDAPNTPIDASIISIGDSESHGDILALEAPLGGVEFGKRKRNPPT
uniref:Uncharacterized protein n=1 Tax=Cannabis sativa TaxID=3483 RepID=A0A803PZX3_CANSA